MLAELVTVPDILSHAITINLLASRMPFTLEDLYVPTTRSSMAQDAMLTPICGIVNMMSDGMTNG